MKTEEHHSSWVVGSRLRRAVTGCIVMAAVVVGAGWAGLVVVIGSYFVPGAAVSTALLSLALVVALVRAAVRFRATRREVARPRETLPGWALGLTAAFAVLGTLLGLMNDLGANYQVLEPQGPGGCRAAVKETSFLLSGRGELYAVTAVGLGWRMSDWTADDGYRPVAAGSYTFGWGVGGGTLTVRGTSVDPVWPAIHGVNCSGRTS